jgi:hypothetical protein
MIGFPREARRVEITGVGWPNKGFSARCRNMDDQRNNNTKKIFSTGFNNRV